MALVPVQVVKGTVVSRHNTMEKAELIFIWVMMHFKRRLRAIVSLPSLPLKLQSTVVSDSESRYRQC